MSIFAKQSFNKPEKNNNNQTTQNLITENQTLKNTIQELLGTKNELLTRLGNLVESKNSNKEELETVNQNLETKNYEQNTTIQNLETTNNANKSLITQLETVNQNLETKNYEQNTTIQNLETTNKQQTTKLEELNNFINQCDMSEVLERIRFIKSTEKEYEALQNEIQTAKNDLQEIKNLIKEEKNNLTNIKENVYLQELGYFDYENPAQKSATLATKLASTRSNIKNMLTTKTAIDAISSDLFSKQTAKEERVIKQISNIMLKAYNSEAENSTKSVRAGNLSASLNRLERTREQITKNSAIINLHISNEFHALRLQEISLTFQHLEAVKQQKDIEREERERLQEERKVEEELNARKIQLQKELAHYKTVIASLEETENNEGVAKLQAQIFETEQVIEEVDNRVANIKAGYVYVISNIGAFGKEIVKIGMTRRLEPMDRVKELGDASVPFRFDTHALIFSDNAVELESKLHKHFATKRVNKINSRKEFFHTTPEKVLEALKQYEHNIVEYTTEAKAEEYYLSVAQ